MTKISVIIPIYNVEQYLERCLKSMISQTLKDIEIICINDGSKDSSLKILQKYKAIDNRIILIDKENGGVSSARNAGLQKATSPYIMFVDPDDWLQNNACETLYNSINKIECDLIQAKTFLHYDEKQNMQSQDELYFNSNLQGIVNLKPNDLRISHACVWAKLFKKEIIDKYQIDFQKDTHYEDAQFMWKYLSVSKNILFIEDKLYNYLRRPNSIMSKTFNKNSLIALDHLKICFGFYDFLNKWKLFEKYESMFWVLFEDYFWSALLLLNPKNQHLAFELANSFLLDKNIEHLQCQIENKAYKNLIRIKNKNYNKIYTIPETNLLNNLLSILFIKKYNKDYIKTKILGITIKKRKR